MRATQTGNGYSKHHPALPLYTSNDAARALTQLQPVGYNRRVPVAPGVERRIPARPAICSAPRTHGSRAKARRFCSAAILAATAARSCPIRRRSSARTSCWSKSTYGDRLHEPDDDGERLAGIVSDTAARGGKLIIPAFAIGRVEEVIYWLKRLEDARRIPVLPVYVDSPMAARALQFYAGRTDELDAEMTPAAPGVKRSPRRA